MSQPTAHICDGGPKTWGYQVRRAYQRKCDYFPADSKESARAALFATMGAHPEYVEGAVLFSQEWYDPSATLRVKVSQ